MNKKQSNEEYKNAFNLLFNETNFEINHRMNDMKEYDLRMREMFIWFLKVRYKIFPSEMQKFD